MSHTMEIQRRRVLDWVHAPETSPPLEHGRHVQSLNAISCIPSVTCVLFLLETKSNVDCLLRTQNKKTIQKGKLLCKV
jgi:hypothetical protein